MRTTRAVLLVGLLLVGFVLMSRTADPSKLDAKPIHIAVAMTIRDFISRNDLTVGERIPHGFAIDAGRIRDTSPVIFDDHWIELHVEAGPQSFTLPAGRTLHVTQSAGRIGGFAFRPFAEPRLLSELYPYVSELLGELERKGWKVTLPIHVPDKPEDFDRGGRNLFAELVADDGSILQMNMRDYGLAPKSESFILRFNPFHRAAEPTSTYLLQVTVDRPQSESYGERIYPRRLFENGDQNEALPLRAWIEDPDWTPEAAGMVPASEAERARPDATHWVMAHGR